jgi:hypothetical protein
VVSPTETFKQLGLRPDITLLILLVIRAIVGYVMIDLLASRTASQGYGRQ